MLAVSLPRKQAPLFRIGALLLLVSVLFSLSSCGGDPVIVTEGLEILETPITPVSAETVLRGKDVLFELFMYAAGKRMVNVPPGVRKQLEGHAAEMAALIAEGGIGEGEYLAVLAILGRDGHDAVNEYFDGSAEGYPRLCSLYLSLSAYLPAERLSALAYKTVLYSYDYRLGVLRQRYENYGYPYLKDEYDALAAERDAFLAEVGEDSFSAALRSLLMLSDLFAGAKGDAAVLADFTPTELLIFLRFVPLEEIRLSPDGFALLLSLAARDAGGGVSMLLSVAKSSGDIPALADKMGGLVSLLVHMRDAMEKADAALLQEGELDALASSLFAGLSEEDWVFLGSLADLSLDRAAYDAAAIERFGADYIAYTDGLVPITLGELRAAVGSDGFAALLPRYLASVTPALAYLFEK